MTCLIDMLHVGIKVGFGILNQVFLSIKIQHHTFSQDTFCKHFKNAKNFVYNVVYVNVGGEPTYTVFGGLLTLTLACLKPSEQT